ncbi:hypothetical protein HDG37_007473, partial [Paraburkholderia sp. MM5384-R2]|nr:hypothetical protein [Paraburkholderia sp. MM5384-R2]
MSDQFNSPAGAPKEVPLGGGCGSGNCACKSQAQARAANAFA